MSDSNTPKFTLHSHGCMMTAVEFLLLESAPSFGRTLQRCFTVGKLPIKDLPSLDQCAASTQEPVQQQQMRLLVDAAADHPETGAFVVQDSERVLGYVVVRYRDAGQGQSALTLMWAT